MKTPLTSITLLIALALTACDSKEERARKEALEHKADSLEEHAKATQAEGAADAAAAKRAAEADAEALKKEAERRRAQK